MRLWAIALSALLPWSAAVADEADPAALVHALRQGGLVVYFRHADTGPAIPEPPGATIGRCETQRNLNDDGRAQARAIGKAFRALAIPVGKVLSSELCRCWETAQLAFGRYELAPTLTGVRRGPEYEQARRTASAGLRVLLSTPPPAGQNTVLVSHGFNLIDLEGLYLSTQGEAAVYRPQSDGYRLLGRILPEEWTALAAAQGG
jgi:broad specificity phosphatase PhoE